MRGLRAAALAGALAAAGPPCLGAAMQFCDEPVALSAGQKDKVLRFAAVIKSELERSGRSVAVMARSGLDLDRFGVRYSHAGFSLRASPETPWAVRQLYYACDEGQPRLYDQGLTAFLFGAREAATGYVSVLLLPPPQSEEAEAAALDKRRALQVLGARYSANAYPWSLRYQNCNQWVAELLATAWGNLQGEGEGLRELAQQWLRAQGYAPTVFDVGWRPLMWLGAFIPWVHSDDHPPGDLELMRYRVSMPAAIESFVQTRWPGAERIEFCHTETQAVVHRGWDLVAQGCVAGPGDTVIAFD
jgi:hypothetical protein